MIDGDVFEGEFRNCVKKPMVVKAVQMADDFKVTTPVGVVYGKAGDYLMIGVGGERYPVRKDIFKKTYEWVEDNEEVFRSMAAIEREFFPNSYKKKLEEEEKEKPGAFGTGLAKEIMEEIRRRLREESK